MLFTFLVLSFAIFVEVEACVSCDTFSDYLLCFNICHAFITLLGPSDKIRYSRVFGCPFALINRQFRERGA